MDYLASLTRIIPNFPHGVKYETQTPPLTGVPRLLCTKARYVSITAIPHILFHMCRQISASARPLIRRGVESPDGDLALPCPRRASASPGVASAAPPTLRVSTPRRTRMRPKAAHEFPRMKSQSPLLYSCLGVRCKVHEKPHLALCQPQVVQ